MDNKFNKTKIKKLSGNLATVDLNAKQTLITPTNITSTVTANLPQKGEKVPRPPVNNIEFTKECVDENHK